MPARVVRDGGDSRTRARLDGVLGPSILARALVTATTPRKTSPSGGPVTGAATYGCLGGPKAAARDVTRAGGRAKTGRPITVAARGDGEVSGRVSVLGRRLRDARSRLATVTPIGRHVVARTTIVPAM